MQRYVLYAAVFIKSIQLLRALAEAPYRILFPRDQKKGKIGVQSGGRALFIQTGQPLEKTAEKIVAANEVAIRICMICGVVRFIDA